MTVKFISDQTLKSKNFMCKWNNLTSRPSLPQEHMSLKTQVQCVISMFNKHSRETAKRSLGQEQSIYEASAHEKSNAKLFFFSNSKKKKKVPFHN